jgi:hypothetical protein
MQFSPNVGGCDAQQYLGTLESYEVDSAKERILKLVGYVKILGKTG